MTPLIRNDVLIPMMIRDEPLFYTYPPLPHT
jgi:hypothetical protein